MEEVVKYATKVVTFWHRPKLVDEYLGVVEGANLVYDFGDLYRVMVRAHGGGSLPLPGVRGEGRAFLWIDLGRGRA